MSLVARVAGLWGLMCGLDEKDADPDPVAQFRKWFSFAKKARVPMANACAVATASSGQPSVRMVLLKSVDERGFVFYTNYGSRKGGEIEANPCVALVFHWTELYRQVRVEGAAERVTREESRAYFDSRFRGSRIGAWASKQSSVLSGREELERRAKEYAREFPGEIPLPEFWGGYRVRPERIEFWQGRPSRLHDRLLYERADDGWTCMRLAP